MSEGYFRKKKGFTVVQNGIVRDKGVSLRAKGLYLVIQSNITMPDVRWRKNDFIDMSTEGRKAFDSAWNELKKNGYLHVHTYPDGNKFRTEYELLDEPDASAHTFYYNKDGKLTMTNNERTPHLGYNAKGATLESDNDRGVSAKGENIYNNYTDNDLYKNSDINPQSNRQVENAREGSSAWMDEIDIYKQIIKGNIEYNSVIHNLPRSEGEIFEEIYQVICDVVCVNRNSIRINSVEYPYELVKSKFLKLNYYHVEYVMECLSKVRGSIENIRAYLLTALYNAPDTINNYYKMEVQKDFNIT